MIVGENISVVRKDKAGAGCGGGGGITPEIRGGNGSGDADSRIYVAANT